MGDNVCYKTLGPFVCVCVEGGGGGVGARLFSVSLCIF